MSGFEWSDPHLHSHCRCAFVSNLKKSSATPSLQLTEKDMQGVLQRDLSMNVYRDGQWGVFRHQLLTQGVTYNISNVF